jgi:N-acetylneuraminic acid mutarotase
MRPSFWTLNLGVSLILGIWSLILSPAVMSQSIEWSRLPSLPDKEGFAAMFAGVSGDALVVAGGANFPGKRPWEGGTKTWYDDIWVLEKPEERDGTVVPPSGGLPLPAKAGTTIRHAWRQAGKLPRPLGYGVGVTWKNEVLCIGGSNAAGHHPDVFSLRVEGRGIAIKAYPHLPMPCANLCGALVGDVVFVAGGIETPDAVQAMHTFWSLNLAEEKPQWRALPPWPGKERMLSVGAGCEGAFYLFSGASLHAGADGKPEREWLKDAFRYRDGTGWEKLADVPRVAVAAASPAPVVGNSIFVVAGDDGSKFGFKPETEHPGFPRDAFAFDATSLKWTRLDEVTPFSRATVPATAWLGGFVIPSGEARPGYRTNEVWMLRVK